MFPDIGLGSFQYQRHVVEARIVHQSSEKLETERPLSYLFMPVDP